MKTSQRSKYTVFFALAVGLFAAAILSIIRNTQLERWLDPSYVWLSALLIAASTACCLGFIVTAEGPARYKQLSLITFLELLSIGVLGWLGAFVSAELALGFAAAGAAAFFLHNFENTEEAQIAPGNTPAAGQTPAAGSAVGGST